MKLPAKKSSLFLSVFLLAHGSLRILELNNIPTLQAITALLAIAAGLFVWLDK